QLLFGKTALLPNKVTLPEFLYTYDDYHIQLQLKLNKSFEIAKKHINTSKKHYDKKMNDHNFKIGDFAYV
ncbi:unnamed protein product, partial [Tenebrio molitor]